MPCDDVHEAALAAAKGQLFVTRYSLLKLPYTSTVNLSHGDISACLTEYMNTSEQTLSAVKLDISMTEKGDILRSAGVHGAAPAQRKYWKIAELFRELDHWDLTKDAKEEGSLEKLLVEGRFELLKDGPLTFRCTCSEERIKGTLKSLPEAEKQSLLTDPLHRDYLPVL